MSDLEEKIAKLIKTRALANERQKVFRANQKATDPEFLAKKAEYEKDRRAKEKLKNADAIAAVKAEREALKAAKQKVKKPNAIKEVDNIYTDENDVILLNMKYFVDINYTMVTPTPAWKTSGIKGLSADVVDVHIKKISIIYEDYLLKRFDLIKPFIKEVLEGVTLSDDNKKYIKEKDDFLGNTKDFKENILKFAEAFILNPRGYKPALNTFVNYLKPLLNVLSRIEDEDTTKNYLILSNILKHFKDIYERYKAKNIVKTDADGNKLIIDYNDSEEIDKAIKENLESLKDKALAGCYLYFPTRRVVDYQYMKVVRYVKDSKSIDNNYLVIDKKGKLKYLVFNKHKTFASSKSHQYDLKENKVLQEVLGPYAINIGVNELLFPNTKGEIDQNFSNTSSEIFTKMYKKPLTITSIRNSAETFNNNTTGRSLEVKTKFSNMMGHTQEQGMAYVAI
jgi:hypothetical protein